MNHEQMQMEFVRKLPIPQEIKKQFPISEKIAQHKAERDEAIRRVFTGESDKFLLIIGPCSADSEEPVMEYIHRLARVQEKVADKIIMIPRIYTNKPRTTGKGYKGMLHQPDPEKQPDLLEGLIAMIWAAAAMGLYNSGSTAGATAAVGEVAKGLLGPVGGIMAILGVIVLPITSGDTALRSCRLMVADYLHIDQKTRKNRVLVTLGIFIPVILILVFAKMNTEGFNILWRYFAWSNQTIGVFAFAAITIYLMAKKGAKKGIYLIALIPGSFYMFIISSFILSQKIGFGLPMTVAYIIAGVLTALYFAGLIKLGRKYAASHEEE